MSPPNLSAFLYISDKVEGKELSWEFKDLALPAGAYVADPSAFKSTLMSLFCE
jgi:hypothetical protein